MKPFEVLINFFVNLFQDSTRCQLSIKKNHMFTTLISTTALKEKLNQENLVIVDCRHSLMDKEMGYQEYLNAHIPNAHYAHLENDLSGEIISGVTGRHPLPSVKAAEQFFSTLGISPTTQVVAYDHDNGGIAVRLWWMLNWLGHEKVAILDGGWAKWQSENLPTDAQIPNHQASSFESKASNFNFVNADFIAANLENSDIKVIDSRTAPRYRGEIEPIDPIAGHIRNAINISFLDNLSNGVFLSKEDLKKRFEMLLNHHPAEKTIFYCGSGVTACHNILAMKHAGLGTAVLYPGSWSDWITVEERPRD
jgi:thiosulfate/3-mercaptopyruvate sulfurtransferase